jgi:hypothetical protein
VGRRAATAKLGFPPAAMRGREGGEPHLLGVPRQQIFTDSQQSFNLLTTKENIDLSLGPQQPVEIGLIG